MAKEQPAAPAATSAPKNTFASKSAVQKLAFLAKFVVFLATLGFAFANVMEE
jgi:hypothetical protein